MSIPFFDAVASPATGRDTALILDAADYAQQVVLRGAAMPTAPTPYVNLLAQIEGLLRPDARLVDLASLYATAQTQRPELLAAMAARTRVGYALKTLLADELLAGAAAELLTVAAATTRLPLVVQVPSPRVWLTTTHQVVGGSVADIDADHRENASMYYADWLRHFSSVPIALLLFDGRTGDATYTAAEDLAAYTPVHNVADHYRWAVGLRAEDALELWGSDLKAVVVPEEYWTGTDVVVPDGDVVLARIPAGAEPEGVLERLDGWR